jgi:hypothetical protein
MSAPWRARYPHHGFTQTGNTGGTAGTMRGGAQKRKGKRAATEQQKQAEAQARASCRMAFVLVTGAGCGNKAMSSTDGIAPAETRAIAKRAITQPSTRSRIFTGVER